MVSQVDEACILEAFEYEFSGLCSFGWGAVEEEREINEL
jgi:hypothetical protein